LSVRAPDYDAALSELPVERLSAFGGLTIDYWSEDGRDRTELLALVIDYCNEHHWQKVIDAGWTTWDLQVYNDRWTLVEFCTTQQNHGGGKRLIRVRCRFRARSLLWLTAGAGLLVAALCLPVNELVALGVAAAVPIALGAMWWRGIALAGRATTVFSMMALKLNLHRCHGPEREVNGYVE
jgi:hypothetical protein